MLPQKNKTARVVLGASKKKAIESLFCHIDNWNYTLQALEEYLQEVGFRGRKLVKQRKIASVIMFMERSFKGKYLLNDPVHWQFINPPKTSDVYREGDMLSEKLERCSRPTSFKKKFDCIGHTDKFAKRHFEGTPLDFEGAMYLCMRDTNDNNKSWFYRNDKVVAEFIESALKYKKESVSSLAEKVSNRSVRKCQVAFVESVSSLLTTDTIQEDNKKTVHSKPSVCDIKPTAGISDNHTENQECSIQNSASNCNSKGNEKMGKSKDKYKGITASKIVDSLNVEVKEFSDYAITKDEFGARVITGQNLYSIWKDAIMANDLKGVFVVHPTIAKASKDHANLEDIFLTFTTKYSEDMFPDFLNTVMKEWSSLATHLKDTKAWDTKDMAYPDIGIFKYLLPKVLMWYASRLNKVKESEQLAILKEALKQKETSQQNSLQNSETIVPSIKSNKFEKSSVGFTYIGQGFKYAPNGTVNRTYEEDYVDAKKNGDSTMLDLIRSTLEKKAINFEASLQRIETLTN
jgi:hypothetical protein